MKKKILIVSYVIPFPINHGGAVAQYFFLKNLSDIYDFTLLAIANDKKVLYSLNELQKQIPSLEIKVYKNFDEVVKVKTRIINKIIKKGYSIYKFLFKTENIQNQVNYDEYFKFDNKNLIHFFNEIVTNTNYDCIQLEFFETLSLLPSIQNTTIKKVFIYHEIRSKRYSLYDDIDTVFKQYMINSMQLFENTYLNLVDKIVVFNDLDKQYLSQFNDKVVVSPYGIIDELLDKVEASEIFNKLIFIGSESHYPNKEGLRIFLDTIYLPNKDFISWPIYITGNWSDSFKLKYNNYSRIVFTGLLKDFKGLYENAILLTPIVSGSGIRTKILQAFLNKVPVLSTKFASEGLYKNAYDTNHIMFYETETEFLNLFSKIKEDPFYAKKIALSGNEYYLKNFNTETLNFIRSSIY